MIFSRYKHRGRVQILGIRLVRGTDGTRRGCNICKITERGAVNSQPGIMDSKKRPELTVSSQLRATSSAFS